MSYLFTFEEDWVDFRFFYMLQMYFFCNACYMFIHTHINHKKSILLLKYPHMYMRLRGGMYTEQEKQTVVEKKVKENLEKFMLDKLNCELYYIHKIFCPQIMSIMNLQ